MNSNIWTHLASSPLMGLTATLLAYRLSHAMYVRSRFNPLLNPLAVSIVALVSLLTLTGISYQTYFEGAQFLHFLLGPATVALAIPLVQQIDKLKKNWLAMLTASLLGGAAAIATAMVVARLLGASTATVLSIAPKSVTTPIAMGIAEKIGGLPSLTAVLVMLTGVLGATIAHAVFNLMNIKDDAVRGFALGVTAHGIGTARAFQLSQEMGAFSGVAMGLSGALTALLLPLVLKLLGIL